MSERDLDLRRAADHLLRRRAEQAMPDGTAPLWDASAFGLDRVPRFTGASDAQRRAVLEACATAVLSESWLIERCGIAFCAKMTLAAETLEARRLFALIGADEAAHSAWLQPWIDAPEREPDPFNRFIAELVESGGPEPLAYLMQVVLEGFGIVHYAGLAAGCRDAALATTLRRMAQDEALHHAGGIAAFRAERMTEPERRFLAAAACTFVSMIRTGPQIVVAALDATLDLGVEADVARVFAALDAESSSAQKLAKLRRLMDRPGMSWLLAELDDKDVFSPSSAEQCARIYCAAR